MTDEYRNAKADAKAEKARAKAMRPWWKKKRFMIPLVLVVLGIAITAAGGGSDTGNGGNNNDSRSEVDSDFSTNDEHPPADDVELISCEKTVINTVEAGLRVTNHSSKESNYSITLTVEDAAGTKVGDGLASTNNVDPGQVANVEGVATLTGSPSSFHCVIEEVERFAS